MSVCKEGIVQRARASLSIRIDTALTVIANPCARVSKQDAVERTKESERVHFLRLR